MLAALEKIREGSAARRRHCCSFAPAISLLLRSSNTRAHQLKTGWPSLST
uniref:Uncharacterized protein n=1 Tax=Arundo donax TaxID=35708 RepID=A0A0A9HQG6_ARUDO